MSDVEMQTILEPPPIVVFDAGVYLQAAMNSKGPGYAALLLCAEGRADLVFSDAILNEVVDILNRPALRSRNRSLTDESVRAILDILDMMRLAGRKAKEPPHIWALPRDAKDEPYINLALSERAQFLVTRDNDLLDLMDGERAEGNEFRQRFPDLQIIDPVAFLGTIRRRSLL